MGLSWSNKLIRFQACWNITVFCSLWFLLQILTASFSSSKCSSQAPKTYWSFWLAFSVFLCLYKSPVILTLWVLLFLVFCWTKGSQVITHVSLLPSYDLTALYEDQFFHNHNLFQLALEVTCVNLECIENCLSSCPLACGRYQFFLCLVWQNEIWHTQSSVCLCYLPIKLSEWRKNNSLKLEHFFFPGQHKQIYATFTPWPFLTAILTWVLSLDLVCVFDISNHPWLLLQCHCLRPV